jgi:uncharacterized protein (DUF305 family)
MQDIERQLDALNELKRFLINFMGELNTKTQEYNLRVHGMRNAGLPVQISDNYEANYCTPNNQHLRHLIENMENVDLQFINANIAHFEQALERARMMR